MRLQVCGWRTVWGAAIDSTQQQQQQRQHRKQIVTLVVVVVRDSKQQQRGSTGARGCYYQVWAREALAGPEGWRKCGAVERCVWRVGPRDALARACCPGYASSSSANSPSTPRPHTSMRGARRLQASSSSLGRLRWGTNAAAQTRHTSIAPLQPAAPGPTFAPLAGQTARAYFCQCQLADRYRRGTFCTYRGYIWIKPHLQPARELCICTPSISVRGLPAASTSTHLLLSLLSIAALRPRRALCPSISPPNRIFFETLAAFRHTLTMTSRVPTVQATMASSPR
jgi:hypothetical protein